VRYSCGVSPDPAASQIEIKLFRNGHKNLSKRLSPKDRTREQTC